MAKKTKILVIVLLILGAAVTAAVLFWDALVMLIAPKTVLSAAIQQAIFDLEIRWKESPFSVLAAAYDPEGKNSTVMNVSVSDDVLGNRNYQFELQTDLCHNQIQGEGAITGDALSLDVSVYLDDHFMALSSQDLPGDAYYGITYDTFTQDLESIPLVSFLLPQQTKAGWEQRIEKIESFMNQSRELPEIPNISRKDLQYITLGILALKCDISWENCEVDGFPVSCRKFVYSASGSQISPLVAKLLGVSSVDTGSLQAVFFLNEKVLARVELWAASGEDSVSYCLDLGENLSEGSVAFGLTKVLGGETETFSASIVPSGEGESRVETVCVNDTAFSYSWAKEIGKISLAIPGHDTIEAYLSSTDAELTIRTSDVPAILGTKGTGKSYDCSLVVQKGAEINTPEYKNLDVWSLQDLLVLLEGAGSVLGLY